jgi:hypothetical protein
MMKPRKHYSAVEKVGILRRHLVERVPASSNLARRRRSIKSEESPLCKTNFSVRTRSRLSCWRSTSN